MRGMKLENAKDELQTLKDENELLKQAVISLQELYEQSVNDAQSLHVRVKKMKKKIKKMKIKLKEKDDI